MRCNFESIAIIPSINVANVLCKYAEERVSVYGVWNSHKQKLWTISESLKNLKICDQIPLTRNLSNKMSTNIYFSTDNLWSQVYFVYCSLLLMTVIENCSTLSSGLSLCMTVLYVQTDTYILNGTCGRFIFNSVDLTNQTHTHTHFWRHLSVWP